MNSLLVATSLLVILSWGMCLIRMLMILKRFPPPKDLTPALQQDLPFVSVVIAARNEERNIRSCIDSLLEVDYPHYEIIVANDRSTDNTLPILRGLEAGSSRLKSVNIEESRDGWTGKNYAIHVAVEHAQGPWFLFSDADTVHCPLSLRLGIQEARARSTGFLTFLPQMDCRGFWESLIQPTASGFLFMLFPIEALNDPATPLGFGNGQYMLIHRDTYLRLGGHSAVKDRLLEDVALSEEAKEKGIPFWIAIGTSAFKTRMYRGFKESWTGWKRIYSHLSRRKPGLLLHSMVGLVCVGCLPFLVVLATIITGAPQGICILASFAYLFSTLVRWIFSILTRQPQWPALFVPLSTLIMLGILLNSILDSLSGKKTNWRGVDYQECSRGKLQ